MKLFFIKVGNQFVSNASKIDAISGVHIKLTFSIDEARFWNNLSVTRSQVTKLVNNGFKAYIVTASVIEDNLGETF